MSVIAVSEAVVGFFFMCATIDTLVFVILLLNLPLVVHSLTQLGDDMVRQLRKVAWSFRTAVDHRLELLWQILLVVIGLILGFLFWYPDFPKVSMCLDWGDDATQCST